MEHKQENLVLITGGARSGKSLLAESLAASSNQPVHYFATMARWAEDKEAEERIEQHRRRRPASWTTHEAPTNLEQEIKRLPGGPASVIIDCLSVYISNLLLNNSPSDSHPYASEPEISTKMRLLAEAIASRRDLNFIVVTSEVGWGVVPDNALGRAYRDLLGAANQVFAACADTVWLSCCGLKLRLKP